MKPPALKRVCQSGRHPVWRLSHPFHQDIAMRLIIWFPPDAPPVVVLFGNNKAQMGDVFYSSVGSRADQVIAAYLSQTAGGDDDTDPARTTAGTTWRSFPRCQDSG
jgi:hypothetical protein